MISVIMPSGFAFSAEIRQAHHNLVAGHCAHILSLWNKTSRIDLLVIRYHKAEVLIFLIKPTMV